MMNLDLVIAADSALAHLAGALGVPVWVPLAAVADWRWLLDREDSPWYPTLRLFRQAELGAWAPVFERMAGEVEKLAARRAGARLPVVAIAPGELLDKITILEIKSERINEPGKLAHVRAELAALDRARVEAVAKSDELARLTARLKAVNEVLWQVEDAIRECEGRQDFGERFVELARSVYRRNDERAALKRQINKLLGAPYQEQKAYTVYA